MVIIIKLDSISIVTVIMWRKNQYIYIRDGISIVIVIMWREKINIFISEMINQ